MSRVNIFLDFDTLFEILEYQIYKHLKYMQILKAEFYLAFVVFSKKMFEKLIHIA